MKYTAEDVLRSSRAHDPDEIRTLWAGRALSAREIAALPLPVTEVFRLLIDLLPDDRTRRLWACDIVDALFEEKYAGRQFPTMQHWHPALDARRFANGEIGADMLRAARDRSRAMAGDEAEEGASLAACQPDAKYAALLVVEIVRLRMPRPYKRAPAMIKSLIALHEGVEG